MTQIDMKADVPVGAIVAFFGTDPSAQATNGWLTCDGSVLARSAWPALFAAIGTAFGSTTGEDFCLPDLRGAFLRTLDGGSGIDPDAGSRSGSGPDGSGQGGNAIGSLQDGATGTPAGAAAFTLSGRFSFGGSRTHGGCSDSNRIHFRDDGRDIDVTGGDAETRPINLYAYYLIKACPNSEIDPGAGEMPVGSAMALPYDADAVPDRPVDDYWRYCDGQDFIGAEGSTFYALFEAIGQTSGGDDPGANQAPRFAIPDLAGAFVRGVAGARTDLRFDPDRDLRRSPRPDLPIPGNAGDAVGSYEDWATAMPRKALRARLDHFPFDKTSGYQAGLATAAAFNGATSSFPLSGGESETRPVCMSVAWHIRFLKSGRSDRPGAYLPLGSIVASGSAVELACWQPCAGQLLLISEYKDLYRVLGNRFGGDGETTFALPDLRGRFLRGCAARAHRQLNRGHAPVGPGEFQAAATAMPRKVFSYPVVGYPTGTHDIVDYGTGNKLLKIDGSKALALVGGDAETRPINVYVQHLIKVRG
jgi:microcystin-dependent protein